MSLSLGRMASVSPCVAAKLLVCLVHSEGAEVSHQEFLNLVNQARAEAGVVPVQYAPDMDPPALSHSQEMAQTGDLTHTGVDGSTALQRVHAAAPRFGCARENVAQAIPGATAASLFEQCNNSQGPNENMLSPEVTHIALGTATHPSGLVYATMLMGYPGNCIG